MAGAPPKVDHVRKSFLSELAAAKHLTSEVLKLPGKVNPHVAIGLHPKHQRLVVELAFMAIVASWEEFIERVLVRYLAGAATAAGYAPTPKYGVANDLTHAYQILSQNASYDPAVHYLKVTDPKWVWTTADFYFSSHPFGWLRINSALLKHAASIRNRVAHDSEKCKASFRETALLFLNPANGKLTNGFSAGSLLLTPVTHQFPQQVLQQGPTHFDAYVTLLDQGANTIAP